MELITFQQTKNHIMKFSLKLFATFILCFFNLIYCSQTEKGVKMVDKPKVIRYGSLIGLKKEYKERYIILHKYTFQGVLDRIKKCNIQNYSIFLHDGLLFSHFEYVGSDFDTDMAAMSDEITKDWWKLTDPMQEPLQDRKKGEWWSSLELLFQMDTSQVAFKNTQRFAFKGLLEERQAQNFKNKLNLLEPSMLQMFLDANIQNVTVYHKNSTVYLYFEYTGKNFEKDIKQLQNREKYQIVYSSLKSMMKSQSDKSFDRTWIEMREVFHTH